MTYNPPCFGYCRWINLNILNLSCKLATLAKEASITVVWIDGTVTILRRSVHMAGRNRRSCLFRTKLNVQSGFHQVIIPLCYSRTSCFTYENNVIAYILYAITIFTLSLISVHCQAFRYVL